MGRGVTKAAGAAAAGRTLAVPAASGRAPLPARFGVHDPCRLPPLTDAHSLTGAVLMPFVEQGGPRLFFCAWLGEIALLTLAQRALLSLDPVRYRRWRTALVVCQRLQRGAYILAWVRTIAPLCPSAGPPAAHLIGAVALVAWGFACL